jgi:hypothetical protein
MEKNEQLITMSKNKIIVSRKSAPSITTLISMLTIAFLSTMRLKLNLNIHI